MHHTYILLQSNREKKSVARDEKLLQLSASIILPTPAIADIICYLIFLSAII